MNIDYDIKAEDNEAYNIISNRIVNWNDIEFNLIVMNIFVISRIYFQIYLCRFY